MEGTTVKRLNNMKIQIKPIAVAVALSLMASPLFASDYYLAAKAYTKTMPDGTTVPMWGYVEDIGDGVNAHCYDITGAGSLAARKACVDGLLDPTFPGPQLSVLTGVNANQDVQLRVYLTNGLPEPTSIIIPGQELPFSSNAVNGNGPTWNDGSIGPRGTNTTKRVRSFGAEAAANGGRRPYIWNNGRGNPFERSGTFVYYSGTHPQKQVYMGLAGMVTKDATAGEVYPGVSYDNDVSLFYSDIDPALNKSIAKLYDPSNPDYANVDAYTTSVARHPTWFLVNGEPYNPGVTAAIDAGAAEANTLLRLASTAMDTHVAVLQGLEMTLHGEDGMQYNYQDGTGSHPAPRKQYSAMLPPEKTKDAIVTAHSGTFAVYDGNGYMTNPSDPVDETVGDSVGGMIRFLTFNTTTVNTPPVAADDAYNTPVDTALVVAAPGVLANDVDANGDPLTAALGLTNTANGTLALNADGSFTYTPNAGYVGPDSFTYVANDTTVNSAEATVSISVDAPVNTPPVADPQAVSLDEDSSLAITLTGSDVNAGDTLAYAVGTGPANGTLTGTAPNLTYTPNANFNGADSFIFTLNDGTVDSAPATVSITVNPVNDAPVADAQSVTTDQDVAIPITLTGSDIDGDTLTYAVTVASGPANGVLNGTAPNLSYVPNAGFSGADSFTFSVNDGTVDSPTATVDITVNATGTAAGSMLFSTIGAGAVPGVSSPFDDADIYSVNISNPETNNVYARVHDAVTDLSLPNNANIDGLSVVDANHFYLSFAAASTTLPGNLVVQDEDVVEYNNGTWSVFFDGAICGLNASNGLDIDAISVSGSTLYFSTVGGGNANRPTGVTGRPDDADVYTWTVGAASCGRALDGTAAGLPGNADIDGLTVVGGTYYISFQRSAGTSVPGIAGGPVQDESVVRYDGANWTRVFVGAGQLDGSNSQNVDALQYQP
jgi:hypothetical protein